MRAGAARRLVRSACVLACAGIGLAQEPPAKTLAGRVVDENGKPVAGAAIGVFGWRDTVDTAQLLAKPPITSAADGTFAVPFAPDRSKLAIAAAGRQTGEQSIHAETVIGDVMLPPGAKLVGRVRDEQGAPLAGVRIAVVPSIAQQGGSPLRLAAATVSDARGIFQVPGVPRTGLRMNATADGYLTETRVVAVGSPTDVTLCKAGVVRGKVVDAAGRPHANVTVRATTMEWLEASPTVLTAADGTFVFSVPMRGRFRLSASPPAPAPQCYSRLLRGAADDVVVEPLRGTAAAANRIEVSAVDAVTKEPLPKITVSFVQTDPKNVQAALFHGRRDRRDYEGKAVIDLPSYRPKGVLVEAPGHGFELVALGDDQKPLVVELGPEAVLKGRVLDEGTGAPIAGVAVRALPSGTTSGSGGSAKDAGPLSDEKGNYVIRGLKPGDYGVQGHAEQRAASSVHRVALQAGIETTLDVTVPKQRFVEVDLRGAIPPGPAPLLRLADSVSNGMGGAGFFQHSVSPPPPVSLTQLGRVRFGPTTAGQRQLLAVLGSRTRVGCSMTLGLGEVDPDREGTKIDLPDLALRLVDGRVELPTLPGVVAAERLAVRATRRCGGESDPWNANSLAPFAGVDAAGRFQLELPGGSYALQLVDLETGIVCHTEEQDVELGKQAIVLKPQLRWLQVDCVPARAGDDVAVQSFTVTLDSPRDRLGAFLQSWSFSPRTSGTVRFRPGAASQRWLVPAGSIEIKALQNFDMLRPAPGSTRNSEVATATVEADQPEAKVVLEIPAPPPDEELERPK